eukprot:CAMPEP_0176422542 /NCGR_PEP_ID=MMETSP0127-20121128/9791_1 /TAXON_ID=938130 /ORGANISM="Platyophrya macrostoma, Strain WH" /LENGTH=31 /DNA_ID= /DNA_START= /DNA_END= /DNA_ORIENTATION=
MVLKKSPQLLLPLKVTRGVCGMKATAVSVGG